MLPFLRGLVPSLGGGRRGDAANAPPLAPTILRLAHMPTTVSRVTSRGLLTIFKAKALLTRMLVKLQHQGLANMITAMSSWIRAARPTEQRFVVLGVTHAWDDTTQKVREPQRVEGARRSTQRVSQTVLVQKNMVHSSALLMHADGGVSLFARAENFTIPPLEVPGKSAEDLRQAMLASAAWTGPMNIENKPSMLALAAATDAVVLTFWPDGASQNIRWLKHVCGVSLRDSWPDNLLIDPQELCLIHQSHRIKVGCLEAQSMIGLVFCFSKLARSGTLFKLLADNICAFVDAHLEVVRGVQPPAESARNHELFDLLFDLSGEHHTRGRNRDRKSNLWQDVHAILALDNSGNLNTDTIVHYCCTSDGRPCCKDIEDTKTKLKATYSSVFISRCWPEGTLSRWTHVRSLLGLIAAGFLCRGILGKALAPLLEDGTTDPERTEAAGREIAAESAGAGDSDAQVQHRVRKAKVAAWLRRTETPWQIAVVFVTSTVLDKITYFLMTGGEGSSPTKLGSIAKAEEPIDMGKMWRLTSSSRHAYLKLLSDVQDPGSLVRRLFRGMGVSDDIVTSPACLTFLRRHALKMSAGLFRRFELRLGSFPYRLWILTDDAAGDEVKRRTVEEFHSLSSCCAGWFGSQLKRLFPTKEDLAGPLAGLCIMTWLRTLIFSTYGCEREHASVRRIVGGAVGPARNFSLVARERVMECTRAIHIDRLHCDPRECDEAKQAKQAKRQQQSIEDESGDQVGSPLFPTITDVQWGPTGEARVQVAHGLAGAEGGTAGATV